MRRVFLFSESEYFDDEGVRWSIENTRPPIFLMNHYQYSWKSKHNHFQHHTDVKVKGDSGQTERGRRGNVWGGGAAGAKIMNTRVINIIMWKLKVIEDP